MNRIIAVLAALGSVLLPGAAVAQQTPEPGRFVYGPYMMGWGDGWYGMTFGPVLMIIMLAVVIVAASLLVRWVVGPWSPPHHHPSGHTALDILKERFARGEIDKAEFEDRRRTLGD